LNLLDFTRIQRASLGVDFTLIGGRVFSQENFGVAAEGVDGLPAPSLAFSG
jgi:hypothetical protein